MLICPDHPTPISIMTHCSDPIPYLIYDSDLTIKGNALRYDEDEAEKTGIFIESGVELMKRFLGKIKIK